MRNKVAVNRERSSRCSYFRNRRVFRPSPTTYQEYPGIAYLSGPLISGSKRNERETANDTVQRSLSALGGCYFWRRMLHCRTARVVVEIKVRGATSAAGFALPTENLPTKREYFVDFAKKAFQNRPNRYQPCENEWECEGRELRRVEKQICRECRDVMFRFYGHSPYSIHSLADRNFRRDPRNFSESVSWTPRQKGEIFRKKSRDCPKEYSARV